MLTLLTYYFDCISLVMLTSTGKLIAEQYKYPDGVEGGTLLQALMDAILAM